ncbi:hypothetical protein CEW89_17875 [Celeribacter ethanolicus]|uniref:Uncharacterized protein n=1 Tax=Celeribacter ethanolicus TaxID=1758178 RepID=A0A291GFW9_9RHOB|nr:hypothetical protein CEW89_17875 [Celeribacter ethanolicus]
MSAKSGFFTTSASLAPSLKRWMQDNLPEHGFDMRVQIARFAAQQLPTHHPDYALFPEHLQLQLFHPTNLA